ncbi:hypothetical protein FB451DRAFT_1365067 [Mycena latifolia]|nr:hypothetical protein FB451DRAFT_1365067 [Mycena latifolia]
MTNPFGWKFANGTAAYALFFKNALGYKAVRLEAPDIGLEFTDGTYIGRDPQGFLCYDKLEDFQHDTSAKHTYHVSVAISSIDSRTYAVIEFRKSPGTTPYAKFYGADIHRVTTAADMGNHTNTGSWITLKTAWCYTTIEKQAYSRTVTVTLASVDKVATWDAGSASFNPSSFRVQGHLHYKRFNKLKDAKFANYNNDRVVFYENDYTGRDFVAFFIPREDATETLGIESTNATPALTFTNVAWVDT